MKKDYKFSKEKEGVYGKAWWEKMGVMLYYNLKIKIK